MKVKRFTDLADFRNFVQFIFKLTTSDIFNKDYGLKDHIQRTSVSIINNISEGFERDNSKEFIKFLGYS